MTTCLTNNDCPKEKSICNQTLGLCIECNHTTDCGIGYQCINNICKEIPYCGGQDLNCVEYKPYAICDPNLDRCVECVINENCRHSISSHSLVNFLMPLQKYHLENQFLWLLIHEYAFEKVEA